MNRRLLSSPNQLLLFVFVTLACIKIHAEAQDLEFSHKHGLYDEKFILSLSCKDQSSAIYYTLDCSEPSEESIPYEAPLEISSTTIVRAITVSAEGEKSGIVTSSYLFPKDIVRQSDNPEGYPNHWGEFINIEGVAPADYGMDQEMVNDPALYQSIIDGFYQLPVVSLVSDKDNFFGLELDEERGGIYIYTGVTNSPNSYGRGWERPVSFEFFGGIENEDNTTPCCMKLHGGNSRIPESQPKHSFRVHFKSKYGPSKLNYPIFGPEGAQQFDVLIIRSFYNNSWCHAIYTQRERAQYVRDLWMRTMQIKMGHPASRGRYCHLFLNGMYWGIYCICERITGDFCKSVEGGKKSDYDVIKVEETNQVVAEDGVMDTWNLIHDVIKTESDAYKAYNQLESYIDIDNLIDYMLLNQYVGNTDWDFHNWYAFYNREAKSGFKFLCWDSETIIGSIDENVLNVNKYFCPTSIFNKLMACPYFQHKYIDRANDLLADKGYLSTYYTSTVWDSLYNCISTALYDEAARWGDYRKNVHPYDGVFEVYSVDNQYQKERDRILNDYFPNRTNVFKKQLQNKGWLPTVPAPELLINGNIVSDEESVGENDNVSFNATNVYYTTDGSDPVSWRTNPNGEISPSAKIWNTGSKISLQPGISEFLIKSITYQDGQWSPTSVATIKVATSTGIERIKDVTFSNEQYYNLNGVALPRNDRANKVVIVKGKKILNRK